jgi:sugar/nucleoside kinase (ribokinase family)
MLRPPPAPGPERMTRWAHLGVNPSRVPLDLLARLREKSEFLSVEPYCQATKPLSAHELTSLVSAGRVFSPNLVEAAGMLGVVADDAAAAAKKSSHVSALCDMLMDAGHGETVVLVRCGPEGGVVASQATGSDTKIRLPAFPDTRVVDVTGCGNSFMGGFLAGLDVEGYTAEPEHATVEQLARACAWGHTSASFMAEVVGVPPVGFMGGLDRSEVQRRFDTIWAGKTVLDDDGDI